MYVIIILRDTHVVYLMRHLNLGLQIRIFYYIRHYKECAKQKRPRTFSQANYASGMRYCPLIQGY